MKLLTKLILPMLINVSAAQNIAFVGNSITANGYPEIVDLLMEENGYDYELHNFGVPGITVSIPNFDYKTTQSYQDILTMRPKYIVVMVGANDWYVYSVQGLSGQNRWEDEYRYLIEHFINVSERVLIGTLTSNANTSGANDWIPAMNERIRNVAQDYRLEIIDFNSALGTDPVNFIYDGIHPSEEGKYKLAVLAYNTLKKYLIQTLAAPLNLTVNYIEDNRCIQLKWDAVNLAQSYRVNRSYYSAEDNQQINMSYPDIDSLEYFDYDLLPSITYSYTVQALLNGIYHERSVAATITTGILDYPSNYKLDQNFPNPFNPTTSINYDLSNDSYVTLDIYNISGEHINSLVDETQAKGSKIVQWNGVNKKGEKVNSGIYFYKLQANDFTKTKKMVLLK
ncbi:GDSL-type esterase/lipase family protein [Candidatus Neomarinimicrobiota bacterium]